MLEVMVLVCTAAVATPLWLGAFWIRAQGRPVVQPVPSEQDGVRRPAGAPRRQAARPRRLAWLARPGRAAASARPAPGAGSGGRTRSGRLARTLGRGPRRQSLVLPDTAAARAVPNDPHLAGAFPWPELPVDADHTAPTRRPAVPTRGASSRRSAGQQRAGGGKGSRHQPPGRPAPGGIPPQIDLTDTPARAVTYTAVTSDDMPARLPLEHAPARSAVEHVPVRSVVEHVPVRSALEHLAARPTFDHLPARPAPEHPPVRPAPDLSASRPPVDQVLERSGTRAVVDTSEMVPRRAGRHAIPEPAAAAPGYPSISAILPDPRQGRRRA